RFLGKPRLLERGKVLLVRTALQLTEFLLEIITKCFGGFLVLWLGGLDRSFGAAKIPFHFADLIAKDGVPGGLERLEPLLYTGVPEPCHIRGRFLLPEKLIALRDRSVRIIEPLRRIALLVGSREIVDQSHGVVLAHVEARHSEDRAHSAAWILIAQI